MCHVAAISPQSSTLVGDSWDIIFIDCLREGIQSFRSWWRYARPDCRCRSLNLTWTVSLILCVHLIYADRSHLIWLLFSVTSQPLPSNICTHLLLRVLYPLWNLEKVQLLTLGFLTDRGWLHLKIQGLWRGTEPRWKVVYIHSFWAAVPVAVI